MGFYDCRCMISGLSLGSSKTILVLLEKNQESYLPIALPVTGQYNRLGSIDMIQENENTETILNFFNAKVNSKELIVDWSEVDFSSLTSIEKLFEVVERGVTMEYDSITLNGKRIEFGLIDKSIWDALTVDGSIEKSDTFILNSTVYTNIYKDDFPEKADLLNQIQKVELFLKQHAIKWSPPVDASQHYNEEIDEYLEEAKSRFKDNPIILNGIMTYENNLDL